MSVAAVCNPSVRSHPAGQRGQGHSQQVGSELARVISLGTRHLASTGSKLRALLHQVLWASGSSCSGLPFWKHRYGARLGKVSMHGPTSSLL